MSSSPTTAVRRLSINRARARARAFLHARPLMSVRFSSPFVSCPVEYFSSSARLPRRDRETVSMQKNGKRYLTTWLISNHARALIIASLSTDAGNVNEISFVIAEGRKRKIFLDEELTEPDLEDEDSPRISSENETLIKEEYVICELL